MNTEIKSQRKFKKIKIRPRGRMLREKTLSDSNKNVQKSRDVMIFLKESFYNNFYFLFPVWRKSHGRRNKNIFKKIWSFYTNKRRAKRRFLLTIFWIFVILSIAGITMHMMHPDREHKKYRNPKDNFIQRFDMGFLEQEKGKINLPVCLRV